MKILYMLKRIGAITLSDEEIERYYSIREGREKDYHYLIKRIIEDINSIRRGRVFKLVTGEVNCEIYNNSMVIDAFKRLKHRVERIQIVGGPVISIDEEKKENRILDLAEEGIIELYLRERRGYEFHYRMIDDEKVFYIEEPHEVFASPKERNIISIKNPKGWIKMLKAIFDKAIASGEIKISSNPKKDFLLLTPSEIKSAKDAASKVGKDYNLLTRPEIEEFLQAPVPH